MTFSNKGASCPSITTGFARLSIAAIVSGLSLAAASAPASAELYLDPQSTGMKKCVRAILGGYQVKHVRINGHDFNCKALRSRSDGGRVIQISHDQFGKDDQVYFSFKVGPGNRMQDGSLSVKTDKGITLKWPIVEFNPPSSMPRTYQNVITYARTLRPRKSGWRGVTFDIAMLTIAELPRRTDDTSAGTTLQLNCRMPTFYQHDNFRGRSIRITANQADLHRSDMGDTISSICVPRGWTVTAYEDKNFRGRSLRISGQQHEDLKRQFRWGDRISSVRVTR